LRITEAHLIWTVCNNVFT